MTRVQDKLYIIRVQDKLYIISDRININIIFSLLFQLNKEHLKTYLNLINVKYID